MEKWSLSSWKWSMEFMWTRWSTWSVCTCGLKQRQRTVDISSGGEFVSRVWMRRPAVNWRCVFVQVTKELHSVIPPSDYKGYFFILWWMGRTQLVRESLLEMLDCVLDEFWGRETCSAHFHFVGWAAHIFALFLISKHHPLIIKGNVPAHMTIGIVVIGEFTIVEYWTIAWRVFIDLPLLPLSQSFIQHLQSLTLPFSKLLFLKWNNLI